MSGGIFLDVSCSSLHLTSSFSSQVFYRDCKTHESHGNITYNFQQKIRGKYMNISYLQETGTRIGAGNWNQR